MWSQSKQRRFDALRSLEEEHALTPSDEEELRRMIREIEDFEAAYLGPATERLRAEAERTEAQNRALEQVIRRKEALISRLQAVIADLGAERRAIDDDLTRILGRDLALRA